MSPLSLTGKWQLALAYLLLAAPVWACSVPVFRYALERWRPDAFELVVFHRGPLATDDLARTQQLKTLSLAESSDCNFVLTLSDTSAEVKSSVRETWDQQKPTQLPWAVLRAPAREKPGETIWAGALNQLQPERLFDSHARRELVRRLTQGDSAVWLLLKSGEPSKDAAAAKLLAGELRRLEKELRLPDGIGEPGSELMATVPLQIKFSVLEIPAQNPSEEVFVAMLRGGHAQDSDSSGPAAFPVFGRGRVLGGMTGEEFSAEVIESASLLLCGACSCQIKEMNPGYDLLMRADWDSLITGEMVQQHELPPLTGFSAFAATNAPRAAVDDSAGSHSLQRNLWLASLFSVSCVAGLTLFLRFRKK